MAATAGNGPVVLLGTAEDEPLTGRIAAELRALGIPIELRVVAGEEPGIDLEVESALRDGARAAVRIDAQAGRTEVSIADPSSHRVALKQVLEGPPTAAMVPVLALRTVEFVRATLLGPRSDESEAIAAHDAAAGDAGIAASASGKFGASQAPAMSRLRLALNSGAIFTPGGLSTQFTFGIAARFRLLPWLGVEVMGFAPLSQGRVDFDQAASTTSASSWIAGGGLFLRQPTSQRTAIELGAGGIYTWVESNGQGGAQSNLIGIPGDANSASVYARVGAELALARNLALRLDLLGGVVFERAIIAVKRMPGDPPVTTPPVAAWDRTFAAALGGVEARWF